jgi:alkylhydroperoxidase family enzyme
MARVTAVYRPGDYPGTPDAETQQALAELFAHLRPGSPDPEIDRDHAGIAIAAQNPRLALAMARMSGFMVLELGWCQRRDLLELAIQTVHLHYRCDFSFQARLPNMERLGLDPHLLAALPYWRTSPMFDDEQRLVIEYTLATVSGEVPEELFARVVAAHGEKGAVEFTTVVGWFALWAMLINATRPRLSD